MELGAREVNQIKIVPDKYKGNMCNFKASSLAALSLLLNGGYFACVRISSSSITSMGMGYGKLIIENAPSLIRLLFLDPYISPDVDVSVISAPKLETLGSLSDRGFNCKLVSRILVIQKLRAVSFTEVVCSVKMLAISMVDLNLHVVLNLMRCFPCLEKLYIQSKKSRDGNFWRRKHRDLIRCLDIRLKTVVLKHYRGTKSQI